MCFVLRWLVSSYAWWILLTCIWIINLSLLKLHLLLLLLLLLLELLLLLLLLNLVRLVMSLRIPFLCISKVFASKLWLKLVLIIHNHRLRHSLIHTVISSCCLLLILLHTAETLLVRPIVVFWREIKASQLIFETFQVLVKLIIVEIVACQEHIIRIIYYLSWNYFPKILWSLLVLINLTCHILLYVWEMFLQGLRLGLSYTFLVSIRLWLIVFQ